MEQELDKARAGDNQPQGNGSSNGNGGNALNRGVIGDGRNRAHARRSSVDNPNPGLNTEDNEPLLPQEPPGLGSNLGPNLVGNLGLLAGMGHMGGHHINPLSLSMGAEEDIGIRFVLPA